MKKILAYILTLIIILSGFSALAEAAIPNELVIGSTTALSGSFFTQMWGSNTSDIDVRLLLHGYNLMEWKSARGEYAVNGSVVADMKTTRHASGERTYTITLQDDLLYSDGSAITAADYVFSILLGAAPEIAAIGGQATDSDAIVGARAYRAGETDVLAGVRLLGDYTFSITVQDDYVPYFYEDALLNFSPYPIGEIAPGCMVGDDGAGAYICNIDSEIVEPIFTSQLLESTILDAETGYLSHPGVVSGPYTLVSFDWETRTAEFARNPHYKGNSAGEKPSIEKLTFRAVANENMISLLESGEVDLLHKVSNQEALEGGSKLAQESKAFTGESYLRSGYSFISFSTERSAVSSKLVRQAIAHRLDRQAVIEDTVGEYGQAVHGHYGVGQWVYQLVEGKLDAPVDTPVSGASDDMIADYKAELAKWEKLSLDGLKRYAVDASAAADLLAQDGWVLNQMGEAFDPAVDGVRHKKMGEALLPLQLQLIYPAGNAVGAYLENEFVSALADVGVELIVEALPFDQLLQVYYRQTERDADMIYLASNFDYVYDPAAGFNPDDAYQGVNNRTAIADEHLYQLALNLRGTRSGDLYAYCKNWIAMQEYYSEVLPTLPVYSNAYADFHISALQGYSARADVSWASEIVGAWIDGAA